MKRISPNAALAADGKAADAFRTIGEVSKALGIQPHVLRYWEEQFPMLKPVKRAGGRRLYRPDDVDLIATIDRLVHREGYTLRGARQFLGDKTRELEPEPVAEPTRDDVLLADLRALRQHLAAALAA